MKPDITRPAAAVVVALGVVLVAVVLDQGSPGSRDAALVVGSLALYGLIPAAVMWLVVAIARRYRSRSGRRGGTGGNGPRVAAIVVVALTGVVIVAMDWIPTPLNRNIGCVDAAQRIPGTLIHGTACVLAGLALARGPRWARLVVPAWFALVLTSAVLNWWVPYLAGVYPGEIDPRIFAREYADNLSFLPTWAGHPVVPDAQHTLIHVLLLLSVALSARVAFGSRPAHAISAEPHLV